jgi:hypothetical protein
MMLPERRMCLRKTAVFVSFFVLIAAGCGSSAFAEISLVDNQEYAMTLSPSVRIDTVSLKNVVGLDSDNKDDTTTYLGYDYSVGLDVKRKTSDQEFFLKLESNGPYDYDAPLFIHNTLYTSTAHVDRYRDVELLPKVEEFWLDSPVFHLPLKIKGGLYSYEVGHGFSLTGAYENYGVSIYGGQESLKWRFYYSRPDLENKSYLGERPRQDKQQGIDYEHAKANFFAFDSQLSMGNATIQPYVGALVDTTDTKRASILPTPTRKDILGTIGASWTGNFDKLSLGCEAARNFGKAESSDEAFEDVKHVGYAVYADASYALNKLTPHTRFFYASGNKVTTDMVDNGDTGLTNGKNRAFSVYSPFNSTIADSHYPSFKTIPLVAMGNGYGLNYGVPRPGTFSDPRLPENIILTGLGFDYAFSEKLSFTADWWYLRSAQRGVGLVNGSAEKLSADLGNELDVSCTYSFNRNVSLSLGSGYFFPGGFYKEERDPVDTLFTPLVRGDGRANGAYQIELSMIVNF